MLLQRSLLGPWPNSKGPAHVFLSACGGVYEKDDVAIFGRLIMLVL